MTATKYFFTALLFFVFGNAYSQKFTANIKDLGFMAGKWQLQHEWGDMEEYWGVPMGDNMACSYRCVKDGKLVFYEFIVIEQSDSVPVMKLHHFKPGNIAWEEKPYEYPLVLLTSNKAVFEAADKQTRLIYSLPAKGKLHAGLERLKDGKWKVDVFEYKEATN